MTTLLHTAESDAKSRVKPIVDRSLNTVHCGDCVEFLRQMPAASIDAVITSPPYFKQRDYAGVGNEKNVSAYIDSLMRAFGEIVRVVKPTGNIVYNLGDKYEKGGLLLAPYRFALAATECFPVSLINNITWVKPNPTPRQFARRLVSGTEPFFHFVKSPAYYYDRDNFLTWGKASIAAKATPQPTLRLGGKYRGLIEKSSLTESQKDAANSALDLVIEEIRQGRLRGFRMKIRGIHAPAFGGQEGGRKTQMEKKGFTVIRIHGKPMKRDIVECAVECGNGSGHSAVFPLRMIREFVRLLCPPNGAILDPYAGSGTTLVAARKEGRDFVGIDIDPKYCEYAEKWTKHV